MKIDNVEVRLNGGSDIAPTSLTWDTSQGGVDFGYKVSGAALTQNTTAALYWSSSDKFADAIGGPVYTKDIPTGTQTGTYGPFNVSAATLGPPPQGAQYLLAVTDPGNVLGNFDPSKNVISLTARPDIVMNGSGDEVTTTDATNLKITYDITNANINDQAFSFNIYRSATKDGYDTLIAKGTLPATDVQDLTIGHHADVPLTLQYVDPNGPQNLPIDPQHPYIVVDANPDQTIIESDKANESNDTSAFQKYVLGVVTHGYATSFPPWVSPMANSLKTDGYNQVIPFDWAPESGEFVDPSTGLPLDGETVLAGDALSSDVVAAAHQLVTQPDALPGSVVDLHFIGHSRGAVVVSQAMQDLVGTTIPELQGGFKRMTLLDPHPANNSISLSLMSYDQTSVLGWVAANGTILFQAATSDPQVVVSANVNQAEIYYQHTDHSDTPSLEEQILNLWGQSSVFLDPQFSGEYHVCKLTGPGIGHSEVHIWYQLNVVNRNLVDKWPPVCPSDPPSPPPHPSSDVDFLYPNYVDNRGVAQSLVSQLASAKAAYERGDVATTINVLDAFINHVQAQSGKHITPDAAQSLISITQLLAQELRAPSGGNIAAPSTVSLSSPVDPRKAGPMTNVASPATLENRRAASLSPVDHLFALLGDNSVFGAQPTTSPVHFTDLGPSVPASIPPFDSLLSMGANPKTMAMLKGLRTRDLFFGSLSSSDDV